MHSKHHFTSPTRVTAEQILQNTMKTVAPLPSQYGYAKSLASIFAMHMHRVELLDDGVSADDLPMTSALVVAPTGQGKTFLFRKMAETLGVNVIIIDCSTLAAEGWRGISLSQRLSANLEEVGDVEVFERSIILLDEADKLRNWGTQQDQGNAVVNLLQLFNSGEMSMEVKKETRHVDISRFTILFGGAFDGLENIIRERVCPKPKIGFSQEASAEPLSAAQLFEHATVDDLAQYGMMRELLGRIGNILAIPKLGLEDYRLLLNAPFGSVRKRYESFLDNLYGVKFELTSTAVDVLAERCMHSNTGARAATPLVDRYMREAILEVETNRKIRKVILDANDEGCYVRYEDGQRRYSYRNPIQVQYGDVLPVHIIKGKSHQAFTKKLMRYFENGGGNAAFVPCLESFLNCCFQLLMGKCRPDERNFESLEKVVRTTYKGNKLVSPFDSIMRDAHLFLGEDYRKFDKLFHDSMYSSLVGATRTIMEFLWSMHGPCQVQFELIQPKEHVKEYPKDKKLEKA